MIAEISMFIAGMLVAAFGYFLYRQFTKTRPSDSTFSGGGASGRKRQ